MGRAVSNQSAFPQIMSPAAACGDPFLQKQEPGYNGVGTSGLHDGCVEMGHHSPWQPEFYQLMEERKPHLGFLQEGHSVQFPNQVLSNPMHLQAAVI